MRNLSLITLLLLNHQAELKRKEANRKIRRENTKSDGAA